MTTSTDAASSEQPTRYRLPRAARVIRQQEFRRIYGRGRRASGKELTVVALRRRDPGHRLGLSVSKANGCAVVRNKLKRILREAFRLERPTLPGRYDVVLIPRTREGKRCLAVIRQELRELLARIESGKGRSRGKPRGARPTGRASGRPQGRKGGKGPKS